jgi:predicted alpha/beta-fold hydrolase
LLSAIRCPTFILAAKDDPIVPASVFENVTASDEVVVHMTRYGGHVGYLGRRSSDPDRNWLEWRVLDFVLGTEEVAAGCTSKYTG